MTEPRALSEWDEAEARVSEGFCPDCPGRLREITEAEQPFADKWAALPFAVCTACHAVICRSRSADDPWDSDRLLCSFGWNSAEPSDPFRMRATEPTP